MTSSTQSLLTIWVVEESLKLDSRAKLLKLLGKRIPHFWQRIQKKKIWSLALLTLDNILLHIDEASKIFSDVNFLVAFTRLLEDIFRLNPFLFCGQDQEQIRTDGRALLKSLRCVIRVAEQRQRLASGVSDFTEDPHSRLKDLSSKKVDEKLNDKCKSFWTFVLEDSEKAFSNFVGSVLDKQTLSVLHSIKKVILDYVILGRTPLEAFFDRGWEDFVHSDDDIFQGLIDIRKRNVDYKGIDSSIIIDIIYLLYANERKQKAFPSKIPLLDDNKMLYVLDLKQQQQH